MNDTEEQLSMQSFQSEDFDAYLQNKWNSNMFTLERRRVKEKLGLLGAISAKNLESSGLKLVMHLSDEFPSFWNKKQVDRQWLFFSRDEAARAELTDIIDKERTLADTLADPTPLFRHIFLGVSINEECLEMGIWMHYDAWVDRRNFINLCNDEAACADLAALLCSLPEHFELGIDTGDIASPGNFTPEDIKRLAQSFNEDRGWMFLGARLPKDQVLVLGADIFAAASDIFQTLVPVYRRIAWSPANDLISIESILQERSLVLQHSREELDRERAERDARLREHKAVGAVMKEEIAERIRETAAWRSREIAAKRAQALKAAAQIKEEDARARAESAAAQWGLASKSAEPKEAPPSSSPPEGAQIPKLEERVREAARDRSTDKEKRLRSDKPRFQMPFREKEKKITPSRYQVDLPHAVPATLGELKLGDLIEVTRGFLRGRRGMIQEIDEKGWIKVGFGMVSSRLAPKDLRCLGIDEPSTEHLKSRKTAPINPKSE